MSSCMHLSRYKAIAGGGGRGGSLGSEEPPPPPPTHTHTQTKNGPPKGALAGPLDTKKVH